MQVDTYLAICAQVKQRNLSPSCESLRGSARCSAGLHLRISQVLEVVAVGTRDMPPRGAAGPACLPGMHMRVKAEHRGSQGKWSDGSYLVICDSDKNHTTAHAGMTTLHYLPELGSFPIMPYAFLSVAGDPRRCPVCKFHSSTAGKNCVCQCLTL